MTPNVAGGAQRPRESHKDAQTDQALPAVPTHRLADR